MFSSVTSTKFGMSVSPLAGETAPQALQRLKTQFGGMPIVRVFSTGIFPVNWNDISLLKAIGNGSDVIYSFKAGMNALAAGTYDVSLRNFLMSRPAGIKVSPNTRIDIIIL